MNSLLLSPVPAWLLRASWQASILTVIVLAAQWMFQKHLSARWRHALWFLVLARLALPFSPTSPVSIFNITRTQQAVGSLAAGAPVKIAVAETANFQQPASRAEIGAEPATTGFGGIQLTPEPAANRLAVQANWFRRENMPQVWVLIWVAGLLIFAARIFGRNVVFRRRLGAPIEVTDEPTLAILADCKADMGVTAPIQLVETDAVKSPALYGFFRLRLLLPSGMLGRFSRVELRHIFLHELAHVKRRDMEVLWLETVCKIMHWFNPVLWFAFWRMAADRELACDEAVLVCEGERNSSQYGETILKLIEHCARPAALPGLMGIVENRSQIWRRIALIANFRPRPRRSVMAAVLAPVLVLVALTDAQSQRPQAARAPSASPAIQGEANADQAIQGYQAEIAAYDRDRQKAAAAIFNLGNALRKQGKTAEANVQYQRILREFPERAEYTGLSQQYLLGLSKTPPGYLLSIGDVLYPGGVAVDSAGNVYVSDTRNNRIKKFTSQGNEISKWGEEGSDPGDLKYPQGLAIDASDNLYVADVQNNRVQKFSANGKFIKEWGEFGSGPGEFNRPYNVAVDRSGNVYVVDNQNNRVQKFTSDGVFLKEFGTLGMGEGQLRAPQGVAVDGSGNIYVGDGGNGRIQKFSPDGAYLDSWRCSNHDVAVDRQGNVYVVSTDGRNMEGVKVFSGAGTLLSQWGTHGNGPGQFDFAARVAVDPTGSRVLVTDANNNRVQIFTYSSTTDGK